MVFLWGEDGGGLPLEQPRGPGPAHARGIGSVIGSVIGSRLGSVIGNGLGGGLGSSKRKR